LESFCEVIFEDKSQMYEEDNTDELKSDLKLTLDELIRTKTENFKSNFELLKSKISNSKNNTEGLHKDNQTLKSEIADLRYQISQFSIIKDKNEELMSKLDESNKNRSKLNELIVEHNITINKLNESIVIIHKEKTKLSDMIVRLEKVIKDKDHKIGEYMSIQNTKGNAKREQVKEFYTSKLLNKKDKKDDSDHSINIDSASEED